MNAYEPPFYLLDLAYALGLSVSAVGMLLTRARLAIGTRTRAELVRTFKRSSGGRP